MSKYLYTTNFSLQSGDILTVPADPEKPYRVRRLTAAFNVSPTGESVYEVTPLRPTEIDCDGYGEPVDGYVR